MDKQAQFQLSLQKFFDAGVLKEIYSSDKISICNVSNCCYGVFEYELSNQMNSPLAFSMESCYIEAIMEDNERFYKWLASLSEQDKNRRLISCNEKTFQSMLKKKQQTDITGPLVPLEYEQELIEKYGKNKSR